LLGAGYGGRLRSPKVHSTTRALSWGELVRLPGCGIAAAGRFFIVGSCLVNSDFTPLIHRAIFSEQLLKICVAGQVYVAEADAVRLLAGAQANLRYRDAFELDESAEIFHGEVRRHLADEAGLGLVRG